MCKTEIYRINHLQFPAQSAIIYIQRVAFLRKSSCRGATRFFCEIVGEMAEWAKIAQANRVAEMRKSGCVRTYAFLVILKER